MVNYVETPLTAMPGSRSVSGIINAREGIYQENIPYVKFRQEPKQRLT